MLRLGTASAAYAVQRAKPSAELTVSRCRRRQCLIPSRFPRASPHAVHRRNIQTTPKSPSSAEALQQTEKPGPDGEAFASSPGLFGISGLHRPNDFVILAKRAMNRCDGIRRSLKARSSDLGYDVSDNVTQPTRSKAAVGILNDLDALSNEVCSVIDAAELCRCVHSSEQWRQSASSAFHLLSEYIAELNSDVGLYETLRKGVTDQAETFALLTEEERRMATLLQAEFERDGIHLEAQAREEVKSIQNTVTHLETTFSNNITTQRKCFPLPAADVSKIIPPHILNSVVPQDRHLHGNANLEGMVTVSSDAQIANTLLKYSPSASLRKEVYMQANTSCEANLDVLEELRARRHELAIQLGFQSYADKFLRDKMARNQSTVYKFLDQMSQRVKLGAKREMGTLLRAKRQVEGGDGGDAHTLHPWDIPFYTGLVKSQLYEFDTSSLAPFFSIENCLGGLKIIFRNLFGIRIEKVPLNDNEGWCDTVQKLNLHHETEGMMGTIYLDLHPRPGKYVHAAHFTIQCRCAINDNASDADEVAHQLPVVALVCNLSSPNSDGVSLLSHSEVETLFHEVGHALHSLLSRTRFQHLSGTRAAVDFVETPSHLMENFAFDERVLKSFAYHLSTGEVIPDSLVKKLSASRYSFQCIEIQNQILYALLDQELFGVPKGMSSTEIFAGLHHKHGVPYAEGTHWHSRFGHLITYGSGYYGYLYDQVFAADIWKTCFVSDPLNRASGQKLRREILVHGGAKDPHTMLRNVLGRDPTVDAFFENVHSQ